MEMEEKERAGKRTAIRSQINTAQRSKTSFETSRTSIEEKIQKLQTAQTNIGTHKSSYQDGVTKLSSVKIDAGSWKGENATKAEAELQSIVASLATTGADIADAEKAISDKITLLQQDLESANANIASQISLINSLYEQLNALS